MNSNKDTDNPENDTPESQLIERMKKIASDYLAQKGG